MQQARLRPKLVLFVAITLLGRADATPKRRESKESVVSGLPKATSLPSSVSNRVCRPVFGVPR